jgi:hypothetical protein
LKRVFWILFGIGAGAVIGISLVRWASRTREAIQPESVAGRATEALADWRERLADALEEGKAAMAEREAELRARYGVDGKGD